MASPQVENGYTRIANELLDAILSAGFSKRQQLIILAVIRKTYGYNKKSDVISIQALGKLCGMPRQHASETVNELARMGVLSMEDSSVISRGYRLKSIGLNKQYHDWTVTKTVTVPKTVTVTKTVTRQSPKRLLDSNQNSDEQKTTQKTTTKDKAHAPVFVLPASIPEQAWQEFIEHRKNIRKPMTDRAKTLAAMKLERLANEGYSPRDVIEQSIECGWTGLFPTKQGRGNENIWRDAI